MSRRIFTADEVRRFYRDGFPRDLQEGDQLCYPNGQRRSVSRNYGTTRVLPGRGGPAEKPLLKVSTYPTAESYRRAVVQYLPVCSKQERES